MDRSCVSDVLDSDESRPGDGLVNELIEAYDKGCDLALYSVARSAGISHDEFLFVDDKYDRERIDAYMQMRRAGAGHEEALEAFDRGWDWYSYTKLRAGGSSHRDVEAALAAGGSLTLFLLCADAGISCDEFCRDLVGRDPSAIWGIIRSRSGR